MEIYPEWKEFLELLEKNQVKYLLIGGLALGAHGRPRATIFSSKQLRRMLGEL